MTAHRSVYDQVRQLARNKRIELGVGSERMGLTLIRKLYSDLGINLDYRDLPPRIKAIYVCDDNDPSVAIRRKLPDIPKLFALVHELKHHFCDQQFLVNGELRCGQYNARKEIEVGAEVFAAEFIFPQDNFISVAQELEIPRGNCQPADVVRMKRECGMPVSYTFICKNLERLGYFAPGSMDKIRFQKLEESIYGTPIYKQEWFIARRQKKTITSARLVARDGAA